MTSPASPTPVAFRLKRPYDDEDQFVQGDGHGIFKSGMVLIGAGPRPVGVIVRFEVALRDGIALFRGEGKVAAHRMTAEAGKPAGLEIKFTRLDVRGKQIVDHALRLRAGQSSGSPPGVIPDLTPAPDATRMDAQVEAIPAPATSSGPIEVPAEVFSSGPVDDPPEPAPAEPDADDVTRAMPAVAMDEAPEVDPNDIESDDDEDEGPPTPPDPTVAMTHVSDETKPYVFPASAPIQAKGRDELLGRLRDRSPGESAAAENDRASLLSKLRGRVA